ncbi:MAG: dihydroneopterin aldolase [Solirubrobacterales bacterium]|nr:dihydroneopterin aldolase [Solirubrobacterales bacterium]MCB0863349.1 dihydroneopterin aldolase [Solirubrobacterales bacterium]MCB8915529.1 dihydroneopterin aldolase [Thermoleophilales bacterium]
MLKGEDGEVIIRLEGVIAHTNHGVTAAEQEVGQRMVFDLEMEPDGCQATATDDVLDTVDYGEVTAWLVESAMDTRFRTLERLVSALADGLLENFRLRAVRLRATKPVPPVPVTMDGASVEVFRRRDDY